MNNAVNVLAIIACSQLACSETSGGEVDAPLGRDAPITERPDAGVDAAAMSCFETSPVPGADWLVSDVATGSCERDPPTDWNCSSPNHHCLEEGWFEDGQRWARFGCTDLSACAPDQPACECLAQLGYECSLCFVENGVVACGDVLPETWPCDVATADPCPEAAGCYPSIWQGDVPTCGFIYQAQPPGASCSQLNGCDRGFLCHQGRCRKGCDPTCESTGCELDQECIPTQIGAWQMGVCEL